MFVPGSKERACYTEDFLIGDGSQKVEIVNLAIFPCYCAR